MRPSLLADVLRARYKKIRRPVFVVGKPGVGKTQIAKQVAESLGVQCQVIHVPTLQPEDCGLPVVNDKRDAIRFLVPGEKLPFENTSWEDEGILVLDELAQADNSLQKLMANLMQERELHGYKLKPGWMIIATGNRSTDRAGANRILSHLSNRMTWYELEEHLEDWVQWALSNGVPLELIQFLRFKPSLLCAFDPHQDVNPTPRAWAEGVGKALGVVPPEAEFETFRGDVGEGAASEFVAFLRVYRNLPDPDKVLANPDSYEPPKDDASVLYALCGAIAYRANGENAVNVMKLARKLPAEFQVLLLKDAATRNYEFASSKPFTDWAKTDGRRILVDHR